MLFNVDAFISVDAHTHTYTQRRVTIRRHNYFYKPIEGTPFSLGLALPEGYGMFELLAEQEIKHSIVPGKLYLKQSFTTNTANSISLLYYYYLDDDDDKDDKDDKDEENTVAKIN